MIKNVVFDMGNVLIVDGMEDYCRRYIPDPEDHALMMKELFTCPEWTEWDRGTMSLEEVADAACRRLPEHLRHLPRQLMEEWHMDAVAIPGMADLIGRLKQAGYGIYLLSNTATTYYNYREKIAGIHHFQGEFLSAEYKLLKPDREIYDAFTAQFGLVPWECYFVDDKAENIQGAKAAGWDGFVFLGDSAALEADLRAKGLIF